jgi:hypothetical protein
VLAILLQLYSYIRFCRISHQSAWQFLFHNDSTIIKVVGKIKAIVIRFLAPPTSTQKQTDNENFHKILSSYGSWIVIINATFDPEFMLEFCQELIDIGLSPYRSPTKKASSWSYSRTMTTSWTKLNILLIGEADGKEDTLSYENGEDRSCRENGSKQMDRGIRVLTDRVTLYCRQQLRLLRSEEGDIDSSAGEYDDEDIIRIEYVSYPYYCYEEAIAVMSSEVPCRATDFSPQNMLYNIIHTALGQIVVEGGVGLSVICPPSKASSSISMNSTSKSSREKMLQYVHDVTKLLHSTILPHMLFRNSGAILHLNSQCHSTNVNPSTTCFRSNDTTMHRSTNHVTQKLNATTDNTAQGILDKTFIEILYNSAQAYLNQLLRSIHYEYKTHGIDCLSVHYQEESLLLEGQTNDESKEKSCCPSPRDILHQSFMMIGKRAEVVVVS